MFSCLPNHLLLQVAATNLDVADRNQGAASQRQIPVRAPTPWLSIPVVGPLARQTSSNCSSWTRLSYRSDRYLPSSFAEYSRAFVAFRSSQLPRVCGRSFL